MTQYDRKRMVAVYNLFRISALEDQRKYYKRSVARHRKAASQVNVYRALFAFLTGLASAMAGLLISQAIANGSLEACKSSQLRLLTAQTEAIQTEATAEAQQEFAATPVPPTSESTTAENAPAPNCVIPDLLVPILLVVAVIAPALGGAFTTLADIYQWDRLITIYDAAIENLEVADAQSPLDNMERNVDYRAALRAYAEGTLGVMHDETAQWGQLVKTPAALEKFIAEEQEKAAKATEHKKDDDV